MSDPKPMSNQPYKTLGSHLKFLREQTHESLMEASGAVEIDEDVLNRIEEGIERPSEDILLLLIQHYDTQDHEALQIWELAGYDAANGPDVNKFPIDDLASGHKQMIMLLTMDMRTIYSDGVDINITQAGMTLNFTQSAGNNKRTPVSRIGMSYDQAQELLKTLQNALLRAEHLKHPRGLPSPKEEQTDQE